MACRTISGFAPRSPAGVPGRALRSSARESGPQVAVAAVLPRQKPHDIVRQFGTCASLIYYQPAKIGIRGWIPPDQFDRPHDRGKDRPIRIGVMIITIQEGPAVEEQSLAHVSPADDRQGIGTMTQLRPGVQTGKQIGMNSLSHLFQFCRVLMEANAGFVLCVQVRAVSKCCLLRRCARLFFGMQLFLHHSNPLSAAVIMQ